MLHYWDQNLEACHQVDRRKWFVMPPTTEGAYPDIYAIEPNEEHELITTVGTLEEANRIVDSHNKTITP